MPFTRQAQSRGGKRPATATQKQAAREWAVQHHPWQKSTGPVTDQGKAIASCNARKSYFSRRIKASQFPDFEQQCELTERFILLLRSQVELSPDIGFELVITRRAGGEGISRWAYFSMKNFLMGRLIGDDAKFDPVWQRLEILCDLCGW